MRVIAFDPGGTTGIAWESYDRLIFTDQLKDLDNIYNILDQNYPEYVVYERFDFRYGGGRARVDLTAKEVIGVIKLWCIHNHKKPHEQTPSQAKKLWTDDKLRRSDLWRPGMPHAMDATRHVLYFTTVWLGDRYWVERLGPSST